MTNAAYEKITQLQNRCPQGKPQTFALSPGVAGSTSVPAYDFAVQIQEVAFRIASPCIPLQECGTTGEVP